MICSHLQLSSHHSSTKHPRLPGFGTRMKRAGWIPVTATSSSPSPPSSSSSSTSSSSATSSRFSSPSCSSSPSPPCLAAARTPGPRLCRVQVKNFCEAQGKGRARGGPRKVTERSFMDGGWWLVVYLSLMLYIKVGCHPPPPPTHQKFNLT